MFAHSGIGGFADIIRINIRRHRKDRNGGNILARKPADRARCFTAAHNGHPQVHQDQIKMMQRGGRDHFEGFASVFGTFDLGSGHGKHVTGKIPIDVIVLRQEDSFSAEIVSDRGLRHISLFRQIGRRFVCGRVFLCFRGILLF